MVAPAAAAIGAAAVAKQSLPDFKTTATLNSGFKGDISLGTDKDGRRTLLWLKEDGERACYAESVSMTEKPDSWVFEVKSKAKDPRNETFCNVVKYSDFTVFKDVKKSMFGRYLKGSFSFNNMNNPVAYQNLTGEFEVDLK